MKNKDDLGTRMKEFYEGRSQTYLLRRTPVIIRVDGKAFHTFCKRFEKPYDKVLNECLNNTLKYLCSNIQCVKMGQRHSDEMSLLLLDYDNINTEPYFEYNVQKICSIVASMTSTEFYRNIVNAGAIHYNLGPRCEVDLYQECPVFDARCFNIPENEIANYFYWRYLDSSRNSINMLAQSKFSHKDLQNKTNSEMQEMLFQKFDINWAKIPSGQKNGYLCTKTIVNEHGHKKWDIYPAPDTRDQLFEVIERCI